MTDPSLALAPDPDEDSRVQASSAHNAGSAPPRPADSVTRRERLLRAGVGLAALEFIVFSLAVLRNSALELFFNSGGQTAGLAAPTAQSPAPDSHFVEFFAISACVVVVGTLVAMLAHDHLAERRLTTRRVVDGLESKLEELTSARRLAEAKRRRLVAEKAATIEKILLADRISTTQTQHDISTYADQQFGLTGLYSERAEGGLGKPSLPANPLSGLSIDGREIASEGKPAELDRGHES